MEAPRTVGGRIQRKPLADCTNVVSRSSRQPSSTIKHANPSLTSSLKRLVNQTTRKEISKDVNTSEAASGSASPSPATNVRPVTRRLSPASAPSRPEILTSDLDVGDKRFAEPCSVYTVRRKRNKDASSSTPAAPFRLDLTSSSGKRKRQANESNPNPLKAAPKKRQRAVKREEDKLVDAASQAYIEQQKAYFAKIDAFELPEEEVSSKDLD